MNTTVNTHTTANALEPQWLLDRRNSGNETYSNLPVPLAKDENWRFASVLSEDIDAFIAFMTAHFATPSPSGNTLQSGQ